MGDTKLITLRDIESYMLEMGYGWAQAYSELCGSPRGVDWELVDNMPEIIELEETIKRRDKDITALVKNTALQETEINRLRAGLKEIHFKGCDEDSRQAKSVLGD